MIVVVVVDGESEEKRGPTRSLTQEERRRGSAVHTELKIKTPADPERIPNMPPSLNLDSLTNNGPLPQYQGCILKGYIA